MSAWALIINGVVFETTTVNPVGRFPPDMLWVACADTVVAGYTYDGGTTFSAPPGPATPTLAQQANTLLAAGLAITSTATSGLNATYPSDPNTISYVNSELNAILLNNTFADGTSAIQWPDISGALHAFDVAQFKTFASALGAFVSGIRKCVIGVSGAVLPDSSATIP